MAGDLTVSGPVGAAQPPLGPCHSQAGAAANGEGSGSGRCRVCAIQTRSHYAQGKSCSFIFTRLFVFEKPRWWWV